MSKLFPEGKWGNKKNQHKVSIHCIYTSHTILCNP